MLEYLRIQEYALRNKLLSKQTTSREVNKKGKKVKVIEHRITQSINLTPGVVVTERSDLEKRLLAVKTAINQELTSLGLAIIDIGHEPVKNVYHYTVPASYNEEDYPLIQQIVEKHCS